MCFRMLTYRNILEYTLVINLINVIYVVKDLVRMVTYRHTLEYIQVIHLIDVMYEGLSPVCILMCLCK
jgi:hypothetical protein